MAKLYFSYAAMNAGKSTLLLQVAHNYSERGMQAYLLTSQHDNRAGVGVISSRIGMSKKSDTYAPSDNIYAKVAKKLEEGPVACVLVDEAQWLTKEQVWQLTEVVDELRISVLCYGLRTDFKGELFPGSETLLATADVIREIRTVCDCGRKATMTLRFDSEGNAVSDGPQTQVGGNESYKSMCRKHWKEALEKKHV